jgi:glycosyltransferase involved in cell wall biosynthesis
MTSADPGTVWIVSELYYPEETSTGYFLTVLAERLAGHFPVRVLCSQPTYSSRGAVAPRREIRHGVRIRRCRGTRLDKDVLPFRVVNLLSISLSIFAGALAGFRRGDRVIVVTNPPLLPPLVLLAARLRGARTVLLIHDVYPEVLVAAGFAAPRSMLVRALGGMARRVYAAADRIVCIGRDMRALVAARVPAAQSAKLRVIPNWGDVEAVHPSEPAANPLRARLGLGDRFVVQFMGNMGRTHGIEGLVEAATRLRERTDIHFLFVGWGGRRGWLERTVAERGLGNVTVLGPCPRDELGDYLGAGDLAAIAFLPGMAGVSVPSRMYNVLAAGRPILAVADDESELARVVREERVGWVVPPGNADSLVTTIVAAAENPAERRAMGTRARAAAEVRYSAAHAERAYRDLLDELRP